MNHCWTTKTCLNLYFNECLFYKWLDVYELNNMFLEEDDLMGEFSYEGIVILVVVWLCVDVCVGCVGVRTRSRRQ